MNTNTGPRDQEVVLDELIKKEQAIAKAARRNRYRRRRVHASSLSMRIGSRPSGNQTRSTTNVQTSRSFGLGRPSQAALAVLRRARETAAAAAQAAAEAAELIERSQGHRLEPTGRTQENAPRFSSRYSGRDHIPSRLDSSMPTERRPSTKAESARYSANRRARTEAYWARVRQKRRDYRAAKANARRAQMEQYGAGPERYSMGSERFHPKSDQYPPMTGPQGYNWQDGRVNYENAYDIYESTGSNQVPYGRSQNEEYLAQARALIQAQNEQLHSGYRVPFDPRFQPTSFMPQDAWDLPPEPWNARW